jgi:hypothetical protein
VARRRFRVNASAPLAGRKAPAWRSVSPKSIRPRQPPRTLQFNRKDALPTVEPEDPTRPKTAHQRTRPTCAAEASRMFSTTRPRSY